MFTRSCLLPVLLSALFAPMTARTSEPVTVLRTLSHVRALPGDQLAGEIPVALDGVVVALFRQRMTCIIDDGTGRFFFYLPRVVDFNVGTRIRLRGKTTLDGFHGIRQETIHITDYEVLGQETLPDPPIVQLASVLSGERNFQTVCVRGLVDSVFPDEINPEWTYLVVSDKGSRVYVAVQSTAEWLYALPDADVRLTGVVLPHYCAERMFIGPHLELEAAHCIQIAARPPGDAFDAPRLEDIYHVNPDEICKLRRRTCEGSVMAIWHGNRFLLREPSGRIIRIELARNEKLPPIDATVRVVGHPETDLFHLCLSSARWKRSPVVLPPLSPADEVSVSKILGNARIDMGFYGRHIALRGILRNLPEVGHADGRLHLECDGHLVPVDVSANPEAASGLVLGSVLSVTGICLMEAENWNSTNPFPILGGFSLVIREPRDVVVLSRPSWWTPSRLLAVIGTLLLALCGVILWNRVLRHLVERRSRELLRAQISQAESQLRTDERTRLAAELHDYTVQNLTAVSYHVSAARTALAQNSPETPDLLRNAAQMLHSCRTELRHCLWDLRNDALDEASFQEAVRKTVTPVIGGARLTVLLDIRRSQLSDATAHALLSICRELVANAVVHGKARQICIDGNVVANGIRFSVRDDGTGFDVNTRLGPEQGHFGLDGVSSRIGRLGGRMDIRSSPGHGTEVFILLQSPRKHDHV